MPQVDYDALAEQVRKSPTTPTAPVKTPTSASVSTASVSPTMTSTAPTDYDALAAQVRKTNAPVSPSTKYGSAATPTYAPDQPKGMNDSIPAARELALGMAEGLGIDPSHPLTSTLHGILLGSTLPFRLISHPEEARQFASGFVAQAPGILDQIKTGYDTGDNNMIANGVGKLIAFGGAVYGVGKSIKPVARAVGETFSPVPEAPAKGFGFQAEPVNPAVQHMVDAVGKTNKVFVEDRFRNVVADAMPDLKSAEKPVLGRAVADVRDAIKVAKSAKEQAWQPYKQLLDSTVTPIDRMDLLREAVANIPDTLKTTQASAFKRIVGKYARDLGKATYSATEIENAAQALNAELKSYYQKNNLDRAAASKLPATAGDEALLSAYRKLLDKTIQSDTGYDPAPLRRRYGNLKAVENSLLETPSGDDTLFEILTSNPLHAASAHSLARRTTSYVMRQTPDQLVSKAFKKFEASTPGTELIPAPRPPQGPSTHVNATGFEGPTGVYPQPESSITRDARFNRALTTGQRMIPERAGTIVTPQPPESFTESLSRTQSPQSAQMRETIKTGPYNKQSRPLTADEYLRTKGGTDMPNTAEYEAKKARNPQSAPPTPPKGKAKGKRP